MTAVAIYGVCASALAVLCIVFVVFAVTSDVMWAAPAVTSIINALFLAAQADSTRDIILGRDSPAILKVEK